MNEKAFHPDLVGRTIFLTGASGFIGSHLLKRLTKEGCEVHISVRKSSSLWRIEDVVDNCICHTIDLTDSDGVKSSIKKIKPAIIFHLAAYGVDYRKQNIHQAVDVNINASVNLFESFLENRGFRFVHTGSCFEYGYKNTPISEEDLPNPTSVYGITKAAAVQLLSLMSKQSQHGNLVILRPFGIFGELEGIHRFFPQVIDKLSRCLTVQITGGEQVRDYIYVEDLIDAYLMAAVVPVQNRVEIINIGSGKGITLKEIALCIAKQLGANENLLQFGAIPYRPDEMMYLVANIEKAKGILGWKPKTSLEKGIENMIRGYKRK
ncbi:MAG: NAD(P)-dependent oxidoreductase [Methanophagales archaeon]|nr:NAD(P)-dependent oxidoreductase [Methanophagales archaeon]